MPSSSRNRRFRRSGQICSSAMIRASHDGVVLVQRTLQSRWDQDIAVQERHFLVVVGSVPEAITEPVFLTWSTSSRIGKLSVLADNAP